MRKYENKKFRSYRNYNHTDTDHCHVWLHRGEICITDTEIASIFKLRSTFVLILKRNETGKCEDKREKSQRNVVDVDNSSKSKLLVTFKLKIII